MSYTSTVNRRTQLSQWHRPHALGGDGQPDDDDDRRDDEANGGDAGAARAAPTARAGALHEVHDVSGEDGFGSMNPIHAGLDATGNGAGKVGMCEL